MVNNKQRETFLHMTSPQVLKAGPLEGQLQAQTKWTFILPKNIYQRLSAWYVPGSKATTEGETGKAPALRELMF